MKRTKGLARTAGLSRATGLTRTARKRRTIRDTGPSRAVRALVLERDDHACARCGVNIVGRVASIHHRVRRSQGGRNTPENLVTLCGSGVTECHGWVHQNITQAKVFGWLLDGTADPALEGVTYASERRPGMILWLTRAGKRTSVDPREVAA